MSAIKLLWVEDDAYVLSDLMVLLSNEGAQIDIVCTYEDYRQIPDDDFKSYSIVVVDLLLPPGIVAIKDADGTDDMLGLDVIEHVRCSRKSAVPIIVLTAVADYAPRSFDFGVDLLSVLQKPVLPSALTEEVHKLLTGAETK